MVLIRCPDLQEQYSSGLREQGVVCRSRLRFMHRSRTPVAIQMKAPQELNWSILAGQPGCTVLRTPGRTVLRTPGCTQNRTAWT